MDGLNIKKLTVMPPYVAKEHRQILEDAETALADYNEFLVEKANKQLFEFRQNIEPHPSEIRDVEMGILNDPIRQQMMANLARIKSLVEMPRFLVTERR